jgi:hypothetical protein
VGALVEAREWRDWLLAMVFRPLMLVFWSLVLWGTVYGSELALAVVREGPVRALERALSGASSLGVLNVGLSGLAALVWSVCGIALYERRRRRRSTAAGRQDAQGPKEGSWPSEW